MSNVKKGRIRQSMGGGRKRWKEPEAREAIALWRSSGLSAAAFCTREGYSVTRLRYWLTRLDEPQQSDSPAVSFVQIALGDVRPAPRQMEIERAGVVLRVREDLDVAHLARLVAALAVVEGRC